jgi:hypothetical protein
VEQFVPEKVIETTQKDTCQFQKRMFHDNRNLAHQFKEIKKKQHLTNYHSHQQIAKIISYQKMEEEGTGHFA